MPPVVRRDEELVHQAFCFEVDVAEIIVREVSRHHAVGKFLLALEGLRVAQQR